VDLFGNGCACRVVRRRRKGDVDGVPLEREDDASYLQKVRFVVVCVAEDGVEAGF
jgi:hypothetical protein